MLPDVHLGSTVELNCAIVDLHVAWCAAVDLVHVGDQLDALADDEEEHHQDQHAVHVLLLDIQNTNKAKNGSLMLESSSHTKKKQFPSRQRTGVVVPLQLRTHKERTAVAQGVGILWTKALVGQ